jgi:hypothetical protein
MNSEGEIRYLAPGEAARADEIMLTEAQALRLRAMSQRDRQIYYAEHAHCSEGAAPKVASAEPVALNVGKAPTSFKKLRGLYR